MHPRETAAQNPEKRAIVLEPSGAAVTYGEPPSARIQLRSSSGRWDCASGTASRSAWRIIRVISSSARRPTTPGLLHAHQHHASRERSRVHRSRLRARVCSVSRRRPIIAAELPADLPATSLLHDGWYDRAFRSYETAIAYA